MVMVADGVEDRNQNGFQERFETATYLADTDGDGIDDGIEDVNLDGLRQRMKVIPDSLIAFDGLSDAVEDANRNRSRDFGERVHILLTQMVTVSSMVLKMQQNGFIDGNSNPSMFRFRSTA